MQVRTRTLSALSWCCLMSLMLSARPACAEPAFALGEGGWRVVEQDGRKLIEMSASITNTGPHQAEFGVRFVVERRTAPEASASAPVSRPEPEEWVAVSTVVAQSKPLDPGASAVVRAEAPYEVLSPGAPHRFRVEVSEGAAAEGTTGSVFLEQTLPLLVLGGFAGLVTQNGPTSHITSGYVLHSAGVMAGRHEAHRVNGEWVENGSGTIRSWALQGQLVLYYTYTARGSSAATMAATATAGAANTLTT